MNKFLIDMNLSPRWAAVLERHEWEATHWWAIGDPRTTDRMIVDWAQANHYIDCARHTESSYH